MVANGAEDEDHAETLRSLRCDETQGDLFRESMPFDAMTTRLEKG